MDYAGLVNLSMMILVVVGAVGALAVPIIATAYLFSKEKRFVFFNFTPFNSQPVCSELEKRLILVCGFFESVSKVCMLLFVLMAIGRMLIN